MKRVVLLLAVLAGAIASWFSILFWGPSLSALLLVNTGKCSSGDISITSCRELLSALGATGDVFGAVTSLFSGLALFAVALTLWADSNSRRMARKPLVVTYLDNDSISLDRPKLGPNPELRFSMTAKTANQTGEPAMNVVVTGSIDVNNQSRPTPQIELRLPLLSGGTEEAGFKLELNGTHLQALLSAITREDAHVAFKIVTKYESLEGVAWATSAVYELRCKSAERRQRLNSFRSGTGDFAQLWENDAAVPLDVDVKSGSWSHKKA